MKKILSSDRSFGFLLFAIRLSINIFFYRFSLNYLFWISLVVLIFSLLFPIIFKIPNILWLKFGEVIGKLINPIICLFLYIFVIGVTRIMLELFRKKLLFKTKQKNLESYWVKKDNTSNQSLDDQF